MKAGLTEKEPRKNQSLFLLRWEQATLGVVGIQAWGGVGWGEPSWGRAGAGGGGSRRCSSGSRTVACRPAGVPSCRSRCCHLSRLFIPSASLGSLCGVAMKRALLPILALWVGCCAGGAPAKGWSLRGPGDRPTPTGLPTLPLPLPPPSPPGPPDGE